MSLTTVRSDLGPAPLSRVVTTAGAQVVLADQTNNPIAANPQGVNQLPSKIAVLSLALGGTLIWLDAAGTSNALVIPAVTVGNTPLYFELPCTAKSIEAATTSGFQIIVAWHPEP